MPHQLPTPRELLKRNQLLPDYLRERSVFLEFAQPILEHTTEYFHQIHLTPEMLSGGEAKFFQSHLFQRHRIGAQRCLTCKTPMQRLDENRSRCRNPSCKQEDGTPTRQYVQLTGPVRGVCKVETGFDARHHGRACHVSFVVGQESKTFHGQTFRFNVVDRCLLVLDRRYHPVVLAAVYRTAGQICDLWGWNLK